jgi:putative ABC transport system permease protein
LIANGVFGGRDATTVLTSMGAGTVLLFIGVAMMASHLIRPNAAVVGRPARSLGGAPGRLAADNSVRNSGRTASTAAALMIGLALVTFVAVLGSGMRSAFADALNEQLRGDYVVSVNTDADVPGLARSAGEKVAGTSGVAVASSVRSDNARIFGQDTPMSGVDPRTIARVYSFDWKLGSDRVFADLGDRAVVDEGYAKKHDPQVGSPLRVQTSDGTRAAFGVRGVYKVGVEQLVDGVVIAQAAFDEAFPQPRDVYTFVKAEPGADNTMILSVFERTRELGMLRAIGMTRRRARRMIRQESVITALIGAALGLPLGVIRHPGAVGPGHRVPPADRSAGRVHGRRGAGRCARLDPARRASRLDVLHALQYE